MSFSRIIIEWYRQNKRDLPWRDIRNPYLIWISEIILQQTQVAQGYDYYLRFVERFPDVRSLADADETEVLRYWQGLGYYSRARNLHAAARQIIEAGGEFPQTYQEVRALKGWETIRQLPYAPLLTDCPAPLLMAMYIAFSRAILA